MTAPRHSSAVRPWTVWTPLGLSLTVVTFLATLGSLGVGFGVMTTCTNTYDCTSSGCTPCETTSAWLTAGWLGQGLLVVSGITLAVLAARHVRPRSVRTAALLLTPLSIVLIVFTTALAQRSY